MYEFSAGIRTGELLEWLKKQPDKDAILTIVANRRLNADGYEMRVIFYECDSNGSFKYPQNPIYFLLEEQNVRFR